METVSEEWKSGFARAQRSEVPSAQTRQIINILEAIGVPVGISISQELASFFVAKAQERGIKVPPAQLNAVEMRSFKTQVMKTCPDFDIKIDPAVRTQLISKLGIKAQPKASAPKEDNRYRYWTDSMLEQMNMLHKDALLAQELREHPLLGIALKRNATQQLPVRRKTKKR